ncbi:MAG: hypothetical protein EHM61_21440 [Acidobacteria bacterium]|nr:MAG: hypothetical protein EHM61_21440 [Acidobacteriota bacterium]
MVIALVVGLAAFIGMERLVELRLSARNRRMTLEAGGREWGQKHYPLMVLLHTAWFGAWVVESLWRGPHLDSAWPAWLGLFLLGDLLRYWCIVSLGHRWSARILVLPDAPMIRSGPYRLLRHPNYLAVVIVLFAVPMIFGAWITAVVIGVLNLAFLLLVRIPAEERALRMAR